jgi:Tat protein translocase TatB subunit
VFGIGMTELLVILVVGLLVLGPKRLPELARSLGRGLAEFRRASNDMRREFLDVAEDVKRPFADDDPELDSLPGGADPALETGRDADATDAADPETKPSGG